MRRLGCKQEGIVRDVAFMNGACHDRILFGVIEDEYRAQEKNLVDVVLLYSRGESTIRTMSGYGVLSYAGSGRPGPA